MSRRLLLFGLLAASQLSTGCWCVRERIAWRWHNHHGAGCAPACGPVCATPAFRIPSPVIGAPLVGGPIGGPVGAPGCSTCSSGIESGPVGYALPVGGPAPAAGFYGAPPVIGTPMPLGAPRIETPTTMPPGTPKN